MITATKTQTIHLEPADSTRLANLCGQYNEHLHLIEKILHIEISNRGGAFHLSGSKNAIKRAAELLKTLYEKTEDLDVLTPEVIHLYLNENPSDDSAQRLHLNTRTVKARGTNQIKYIKNIKEHDINFGIGPAGTGKTYLAVACAVEALEKNHVSKLILARPAVEAGEQLGFLPGDLIQKVDPYLRPLYDALYDMMSYEKVIKLIERNVIEIAPLAYMRGRTLNDAFIILDEAQNTTQAQMQMLLTRIGFGSKAVITGDITQIDLPDVKKSGLTHAIDVLKSIRGIEVTHFTSSDVVRHALVQKIINAYQKNKSNGKKS